VNCIITPTSVLAWARNLVLNSLPRSPGEGWGGGVQVEMRVLIGK